MELHPHIPNGHSACCRAGQRFIRVRPIRSRRTHLPHLYIPIRYGMGMRIVRCDLWKCISGALIMCMVRFETYNTI